MGKGNIMRTKCFHMLFLPLFFQSLTFHLFSLFKTFLEATNLNSISFFSRSPGTTSPPSLSFVPATVILWAVKNSFTWHAPTEPGTCDGSAFGKKWKKKNRSEEKKPTLSAMLWLCMLRKLHPQVIPCTTWAKEGKSTEAKAWLSRQESPATDPALSQVPWRRTDMAVATFITSYNLQTTLTSLQWAQKQAKIMENPIIVFYFLHISCVPQKGKKPSWVKAQSFKS